MAAASDCKGTHASRSARTPSDDAEQPSAKDGRALTALALNCLPAVAVLLFLAYGLVPTARRVRGEPWDLAFVAFAYADLAAIFCCIRRAERLVTPAGSPPAAGGGERRRLQVAVWALSTVLSCAFAYRVSLIMAPALVVVVWSMTSFVVLVGFYVLVVCKDQEYHVLEGDGDAGTARGKGLKKNNNGAGDELV